MSIVVTEFCRQEQKKLVENLKIISRPYVEEKSIVDYPSMASLTIHSCRAEEKVYADQAIDRISELPDDNILTILSFLELKEAGRTSILSTRWQYLWTHLTHLDFDTSRAISRECRYEIDMDEMIPTEKYVNWVNKVMSIHDGPQINKLKIFNYFGQEHVKHINKWVTFALSKRVKELFLSVQVYSDPQQSWRLDFDFLKNSACDSGLNYLTSLDLDHVEMSGEFIEYLLSRCHLLERLALTDCENLVSFKVVNSALKLKHLSIRNCLEFEQLEIDSSSLMSFELQRFSCLPPPNILFTSVPLLVEVSVGSSCSHFGLPEISCVSQQLSKLSVYVNGTCLFNEHRTLLPDLLSFSNVKHLVLTVISNKIFNFEFVIEYIQTCPWLHDLTLQIDWEFWDSHKLPYQSIFLRGVSGYSDCEDDTEDDDTEDDDTEDDDAEEDNIEEDDAEDDDTEEEEQELILPHDNTPRNNKGRIIFPNLKAIVWDGFQGSDDVSLILHTMNHAPALETIKIIIWKPRDVPNEDGNAALKVYRRRAYKFAKILPPTIKLIVEVSRVRSF